MKTKEQRYVYFGEYPQTIKADDVEITEIQDERGYYLGTDGYYYAKVISRPYYCQWIDEHYNRENKSDSREDNGFNSIVGDHYFPILQGHTPDAKFKLLPVNNAYEYKFSNGLQIQPRRIYFFKVEPIEWIVLYGDDNVTLLSTSKIIDCIPYSLSNSTYKSSLIRMWLNGYQHEKSTVDKIKELRRNGLGLNFINLAFNEKEREAIIEVEVKNSQSTTNNGNSYLCSTSTYDKVYLLSYEDTINSRLGFNGSSKEIDHARMRDTTDFSRAIGVQINGGLYGTNAEWWLRSAQESHTSSIVNYNGNSNNIAFVSTKANGVVPAISLNLLAYEDILTKQNAEETLKGLKKRIALAKKADKIEEMPVIIKNSPTDLVVKRLNNNSVIGYGNVRGGNPKERTPDSVWAPKGKPIYYDFRDSREYDEENAYYDIGDDRDYYNPYLNDISEE